MLITTTESVAGREVSQVLGLVKGNTIQTRHIGSDIVSGLKSIVGGEIKGYVKAMNIAREEATTRMLEEARALGADAIICTRYSTSQVMTGGAEILAYGTAVKLR
ncbi:YbjQ family protein [Candidatus Parcubacteria bacterium]|nr:YbjQ family protein [Candidatus Parcubacteria bacterium]